MTGGGSRLPGTPDEDGGDPIVLHVDMDCFYAACERRREPELGGEPVVVGMGYEGGESHGAVATASYEAREYGVESAQAISTALERLPRKAEAESPETEVDPDEAGYYRPVDMDYYEEVSAGVKEILHDSADVVREVSIDEAYLDVTDRTAWEVAEGFARHVKHRIDREVGVAASVGVAPNMSTAKIASDHDKPDGLVVVEPGEIREFLAPLDVGEIHGVGPVTARELREMGVQSAGDLAEADRGDLETRFGERGAEMYRRARGEDRRVVTPTGRPKSLSRESAFTEATDDREEKRDRIRTLAEAVADRAGRKGAMYRTIGIKAVTPPYDVNTRAKSLPGPVDEPALVEEVALDLLSEFDGAAVRKVGVRVSNLSFAAGEQASLGDGWESSAGRQTSRSDGPDDDQRSLGEQWASESVESGETVETGKSSETAESDDSRPSADRDGQLSLGREWNAADDVSGKLAVSDDGNDDGNGNDRGDASDTEDENDREEATSEDGSGSDRSADSDSEGQVSLGDFESVSN